MILAEGMPQLLFLCYGSGGGKSLLPENVVRYPILRLDDPYKVDRNILFHFLFGSTEYRDDRMRVKDCNEPLVHSA